MVDLPIGKDFGAKDLLNILILTDFLETGDFNCNIPDNENWISLAFHWSVAFIRMIVLCNFIELLSIFKHIYGRHDSRMSGEFILNNRQPSQLEEHNLVFMSRQASHFCNVAELTHGERIFSWEYILFCCCFKTRLSHEKYLLTMHKYIDALIYWIQWL